MKEAPSHQLLENLENKMKRAARRLCGSTVGNR